MTRMLYPDKRATERQVDYARRLITRYRGSPEAWDDDLDKTVRAYTKWSDSLERSTRAQVSDLISRLKQALNPHGEPRC